MNWSLVTDNANHSSNVRVTQLLNAKLWPCQRQNQRYGLVVRAITKGQHSPSFTRHDRGQGSSLRGQPEYLMDLPLQPLLSLQTGLLWVPAQQTAPNCALVVPTLLQSHDNTGSTGVSNQDVPCSTRVSWQREGMLESASTAGRALFSRQNPQSHLFHIPSIACINQVILWRISVTLLTCDLAMFMLICL